MDNVQSNELKWKTCPASIRSQNTFCVSQPLYWEIIMSVDTVQIKPRQKFEGHTKRVSGVIHLPGGQQFMTCSLDGSLGVWNLQNGEQISNWRDGECSVRAIELSKDGKEVVSGSDDGVVRLWRIETGKVIAKWTGHTENVSSLCWNGDGVRVLSGSWDGTARVWDAETGKTILEISTGTTQVYAAIFSPDSTLIATSGFTRDAVDDKLIKIWDANTGEPVTILKGHTRSVHYLTWTANGRTLITGAYDDTIRTWDTSTWQQLAVLTGHTHFVCGIAISPNGRILASASWDKTAQLWNLQNGQPIASPLQHSYYVNCVSFSTDGTLLATGCDDNNAYTWDIPAIIRQVGLDELLQVEDGEKSFLLADATRRPVQQPKNVSTIPTTFFGDIPTAQHPDSQPTIASPITPPVPNNSDAPPELEVQPSSPEPQPTQSRFLRWLRGNTPALPTFLQRVRLPSFKRPQRHGDEGIEMQERPASTVSVPLAHGKLRYANEWGVRKSKEKQKQRKKEEEEEIKRQKMKDADHARIVDSAESAGRAGRPHIAQPVAGLSQSHTSLEPQAVATSPKLNAPPNASPPAAVAPSTPHANIVIPCPRCCIPFFSCLGCVSGYSDGHH